ncbi:MAG: glycosyltransferase family 2 protein, partial [Caldilineaceae bacterium]|nr:glycosyltransferase family 2 protein [Caldilineaceae bacterium]
MIISIIINNYNYAHYLAQAIESALAQSYDAVEVIVVDDGSTDDSRSIIRSYGARVTSIFKANGGQASALNAGFASSRGDVVIFLDADDLLLPETAAHVQAAFCAQPDLAKVQYPMAVINEKGVHTGQVKPSAHLLLHSGDLRRQVLTFPFDIPWMATSGNAFSARVLRQIFPIPEGVYGKAGADWYLAHLTPLFGPVLFLDEVGACYRIHQANHYEQAESTLNLAHMRQTIVYAHHTLIYLKEFAKKLDLMSAYNPREALSVSDLANRLVLLRTAPADYPIRG